MPEINMVRNPMYGYNHRGYQSSGELTIPEIPQVKFAPGELKEIEIVHARGLTREGGYSYVLLQRIAERMKDKGISYREAYLELRGENL